jgi:glycerol uptake facilitator-like aquaporin
MALRRALPWGHFGPYALVQIIGGVAGAMLANLMFDLPVLTLSETVRGGGGQLISEAVATFTLIGAILGGLAFAPGAIPWLVGLTITAAYWFTASTSFANPAVTLARTLSDSFAGIAPASAPGFIAAQIAGALLGGSLWGWLFKAPKSG